MGEVNSRRDLEKAGFEFGIQQAVSIDEVRMPGLDAIEGPAHAQHRDIPGRRAFRQRNSFARLRSIHLMSKREFVATALERRKYIGKVIFYTGDFPAARIDD